MHPYLAAKCFEEIKRGGYCATDLAEDVFQLGLLGLLPSTIESSSVNIFLEVSPGDKQKQRSAYNGKKVASQRPWSAADSTIILLASPKNIFPCGRRSDTNNYL